MQVLLTAGTFIAMLVVVVMASNHFVQFAAKIAKRFGVSEFIIGLTLVAVGTSLPELTNTLVSSIKGVNAFALGNVLGSNMANICLSIGLSILLARIVIQPRYYRREILVLLVATIVFGIAMLDGQITRAEAAILIALFLLYMNYVTRVLFDFGRLIDPKELAYFVEHLSRVSWEGTVQTLNNHYKRITALMDRRFVRDAIGVLVSAAVLVAASDILVDKAISLASAIGVTSTAVGATIVAIGTTTPELSVSLASVRKGYYHMLFGNIIGSNIINFLLIIGIGAAIHPIVVPPVVVWYSLPIVAFATLLFCWLLTRKQELHRNYGILLLMLYGLFLFLMVVAH